MTAAPAWADASFHLRTLLHGARDVGESGWGVGGWLIAPNIASVPDTFCRRSNRLPLNHDPAPQLAVRMTIPVELGDAFRSWCNPSGEETGESTFDLACLKAGLAGYASAAGRLLEATEIDAIVPAVELVTLELASRFCADALEESYFAWNHERFASATAHNLLRARSQLSLAQSFAGQRSAARDIVEDLFGF